MKKAHVSLRREHVAIGMTEHHCVGEGVQPVLVDVGSRWQVGFCRMWTCIISSLIFFWLSWSYIMRSKQTKLSDDRFEQIYINIETRANKEWTLPIIKSGCVNDSNVDDEEDDHDTVIVLCETTHRTVWGTSAGEEKKIKELQTLQQIQDVINKLHERFCRKCSIKITL